jgi:hypothetical protein
VLVKRESDTWLDTIYDKSLWITWRVSIIHTQTSAT